VVGRDPEVVVVAVRHADGGEGPPAVLRTVEAGVEDVDGVGVPGVGEDVRVVPGPLAQPPLAVGPLPGRAAVIAAIDTAVVGLDQRPHAAGVGGGDGDAGAAPGPLGQA